MAVRRAERATAGTADVDLVVRGPQGATGATGATGPIGPVGPYSRPPVYRAATTSFLMQTGHGWTSGGGGTASSDVNDTTDYCRGTQSIRVTTTGTAVQSQVRKTAMSAMDLTGKAIRVTLKLDNVARLDRIEFVLGTSTFANFFKWLVHTHSGVNQNYVQSGEWVVLTFSWADVTSTGGTYAITAGLPSTKTGFTDMQVSVYDNGTGALTYRLQSVEVIPDTTTTFPNGVVSVTFDDTYASQFTLARPKMDALGYRGTVYTIADAIGSGSSYMTLGNLRTLQDLSGWEVAGHAYYSANHSMTNGFADLTSAQVSDDFGRLRDWLSSNGFTSSNFAYPKGHFDVTTDGVPVDQIAGRYWTTSRTIIGETKELWPPAVPQRVKALTGVSDAAGAFNTPTTMAASGGPLDRTKGAGNWLILCLHKLVTTTAADTTEITQTGFNTLMDAIAARGIPVLPINDVVRYYT